MTMIHKKDLSWQNVLQNPYFNQAQSFPLNLQAASQSLQPAGGFGKENYTYFRRWSSLKKTTYKVLFLSGWLLELGTDCIVFCENDHNDVP